MKYVHATVGLLLLGVASAAPVQAAPRFTTVALEGARLARNDSGQGITLGEAVRRVRQRTHGQVLAADTVTGQGGTLYRIKVLTPQGEVRIIYVDARTGEFR